MTLFRLLKTKSMTVMVLLLAAMASGGCREESKFESSETCRCAHPNAGLRSVAEREQKWTLSGTLKLTPPPKDRINGKVMLYIDEQHVFSEQRHRLIEKEITISYEEEHDHYEQGKCGNDKYYDDYYESSQSGSCDCSFGLSDQAWPDIAWKTDVKAVAHGSADSIDLINLQIDFVMPDKRSTYFAGIHIDNDGDGTVSDGDYFTKEFVEIDVAGERGLRLVGERIESEKSVASGKLDLQTLAAPDAGATMQVALFDISVPQKPKKVASLTRQDAADLSFVLSTVPETENAIWQLTAWIDTNKDGKLDVCDYVEAEKTVRYSLVKLKDMVVPMTYAGGTDAECAAMPEEEEEEEEEEETPGSEV